MIFCVIIDVLYYDEKSHKTWNHGELCKHYDILMGTPVCWFCYIWNWIIDLTENELSNSINVVNVTEAKYNLITQGE